MSSAEWMLWIYENCEPVRTKEEVDKLMDKLHEADEKIINKYIAEARRIGL